MASYYPIIITKENAEYAIRSNILRAFDVLETKLLSNRPLPIGKVDCQGNRLRGVGEGTHDNTAATFGQLADLLA